MRDLAILFIHLLTTIAKLMRPSGGRAVIAESLLLKQQLLVLNRSRERAPNLRPVDLYQSLSQKRPFIASKTDPPAAA